jgi:hypothetical protein
MEPADTCWDGHEAIGLIDPIYQDACFEMNQWTSIEIELKEDIGNAFLAEPLATGVRSVNVKEPCTAYSKLALAMHVLNLKF